MGREPRSQRREKDKTSTKVSPPREDKTPWQLGWKAKGGNCHQLLQLAELKAWSFKVSGLGNPRGTGTALREKAGQTAPRHTALKQ